MRNARPSGVDDIERPRDRRVTARRLKHGAEPTSWGRKNEGCVTMGALGRWRMRIGSDYMKRRGAQGGGGGNWRSGGGWRLRLMQEQK